MFFRKIFSSCIPAGTDAKEAESYVYRNKNNLDIINTPNQYGNTLLISAASRGHTRVVELLLSIPGIDINAVGHHGYTALMWAAHRGHFDIVKALLRMPGIDITHRNNENRTAAMEAEQQGHADIVNLFRAPGPTRSHR